MGLKHIAFVLLASCATSAVWAQEPASRYGFAEVSGWVSDPLPRGVAVEFVLLLLLAAFQYLPVFRKMRRKLVAGTKVVGLLVALVTVLLTYRTIRLHGDLTQCKSNLRYINTSLEMYATDNGGGLPPRLNLLFPKYLKEVPQCPAAHTDTYTQSYQFQNPGRYTLCCSGLNHRELGIGEPNYPQSGSFIPYGLNSSRQQR